MNSFVPHQTRITVFNVMYYVTFLSQQQKIAYLASDGLEAGVFDVRNGMICSRKPADHILINEMEGELLLLNQGVRQNVV